jgi:UDP-glucose 6-dehydrogenase
MGETKPGPNSITRSTDPPDVNGAADLTAIEHTVTKVRNLLRPNTVLVTKSTVPVGTSNKISAWLGRENVAVGCAAAREAAAEDEPSSGIAAS